MGVKRSLRRLTFKFFGLIFGCLKIVEFRAVTIGLTGWMFSRSLVFSLYLQWSCAMRSKAAAIGLCCCSLSRVLSARPMGSYKELGHLVWLK
jgi:hypothetical protein